jgi:peptidoglycan/LPS O-acetylase OafA/YrhL
VDATHFDWPAPRDAGRRFDASARGEVTAGPGAGRMPTLDGLRGIAVLAVVIEHAWPNLLPGGFAGVDVFFVLSGYLITGLLLRELARTGTVDLVSFYARRVRRIIPAATVCVIVVAILFTAVLGVGFGRSFRTEALSAALSVSNLLFVSRSTDYFAADPSSSPFLHYWSLAVEEQFYLFWPTLLLLLFAAGRWAGRRAAGSGGAAAGARVARWVPVSLAALIAVASFGLTVVSSQATAFFLLPHRAWELLAGGLLAWLPLAATGSQRRGIAGLRWALAIAGVVALAITFAGRFERWPGLATALPVLGTAALIVGGTSMPGARWLSTAWLRFLGRISYALYLWHWPILAAVALIALPAAQPPLWMTVLAVAIAIGAAIASTFLLEEPIRFTPTRWLTRVRALAAAGAFVALASVAVVVTTSAPSAEAAVVPGTSLPPIVASPAPGASALPAATAPPDIRPLLRTIPDDHERLNEDRCSTNTQESVVRRCVYGAAANADGSPTTEVPAGMPVAVLFGDSHAMHWFTAVNAWATDAGMALVPLTRSGCPAVDADVTGEPDVVQACRDWRAGAFARMAELDTTITIVASSSGVAVSVDGTRVVPRFSPEPWIAPTARFMDRLAAVSRTVVYIADVPRPGFVVPDCLAAHWRDLAVCALPVAKAQPATFMAAEQAMADAAGVTLIDPTAWICPDGTCTWLLGDRIAYRDDHHLTASASLLLARPLAPFLDAAVEAAAAGAAGAP